MAANATPGTADALIAGSKRAAVRKSKNQECSLQEILLIPLALVYLLTVSLLFIYGINFLYLTFVASRNHRQKREIEVTAPAVWPTVTVQLPVYNELYVVERLIAATAALDYPSDRLEIQVLDDSTDETIEIIRQAVASWRAKGVSITHIQRTDRAGYKAGALQNGLQTARGEFIAIFDADFVPTPEFLRQTIPHFDASNVAFVQTRWDHLNRSYSLLTTLQSLAIDAHFMIEQYARARNAYLFNFNGTAGVWRRDAMLDVGGWQADTLTEDLDLSYRVFLKGWLGRYVRDVTVPAELPVHFSGFRRQQHRWARGSLECALKLTPAVWRAPLPVSRKIQATLHLTGYVIHLLMLLMAFLYFPVLRVAETYPQITTLFGLAYIFNLTALAPTIYVTTAQHQIGRNWLKLLPRILLMIVVGFGMMLNTGRAALQIALGRVDSFERTAKFGIEQSRQAWINKRYQLKLDPIVYWESATAALFSYVVIVAIRSGIYAIAFYAAVVVAGLVFVATMTVIQAIAVRRSVMSRNVAADQIYEERPAPVVVESAANVPVVEEEWVG